MPPLLRNDPGHGYAQAPGRLAGIAVAPFVARSFWVGPGAR